MDSPHVDAQRSGAGDDPVRHSGLTTGSGGTKTTRDTVSELLQRFAAGDPGKISDLYAEQVAWKLDWPPGDYSQTVPWICDRSTRAGVADHFRLIAEHHVADRSSATVSAILVDGDDAVVLGELHNTARRTGRSYISAFALHLTVEEGLITRHHIYEDSLAVMQAFSA